MGNDEATTEEPSKILGVRPHHFLTVSSRLHQERSDLARSGGIVPVWSITLTNREEPCLVLPRLFLASPDCLQICSVLLPPEKYSKPVHDWLD